MLKSGWVTPALLLAIILSSAPAPADTASDIGQQLKSVCGDGTVEVWTLPDETIVSLDVDGRTTEDDLRKQAGDVLKVVSANDLRKAKALKVLFVDKVNRTSVQAINMSAEQVTSGNLSQPPLLSRGQRAFISNASGAVPSGGQTIGGVSASLSQAQFQSERTKLITRLQALQSKGVGVKPFFDEMNKVDEQFKRADLGAASSSLRRLDTLVSEQDKTLRARVVVQSAAPTQTQSQPPARPQRAMVPAQAGWGGLDLSNPNLSPDAAHEEIARHLLQQELGDLAPSEGPFRLERFRIAEQMKKMQSQGQRIDALKGFFKRVDDLAMSAARDPRKMTQLRDEILYLQRQVGLSEMQGTSKYKD